MTDLCKIALENSFDSLLVQKFEMARMHWGKDSYHRHEEITLRRPELTSAVKAQRFNKFVDHLESLQDETLVR